MNALAIEDGWRLLFEEDILRNRARNRKEQEKEAERNFTFYAEGGPKDVFVGLPQEYKSPAAERRGSIPKIDVVDGDLYIKTDIVRSRQLTKAELSPALLEHRKRTPLCWLDPCNDPACRLDHEGREIQVFDGDLSRYWER